ncbi:TRAP transporter fused permease subunit [Neobacillus niacini]|uniref:TRAP transporter permease n=1 Tax=Neobacillus niacini TaxID=86668 RepID=UPI0007AC0E47|nr:TRAP transporter fused permease subunit [Neobacillus niacini]MEC1524993.1 TRAP transporter fused permease subunit [Neobacillus niacini]
MYIDRYLEGVKGGQKTKVVIFITAILFSLFHLLTAGVQPLTSLIQASVHVGFGLFMTYLLYPTSSKSNIKRIVDYLFMAVALVTGAYVVLNVDRFIMDPFGYTSLDILLGTLLIIVILDASRRTVGWSVPIMTLIMILYTAYGQWIPGEWGHGGMGWEFIVSGLYMTGTGIYGQTVLIVATTIAIFLIFGAALEATGASNSFMGLALKLTGKSTGGPAKVAVVSSAMFGTISGNTAANVVVTGSFTIPLMRRLNYPGYYAAAVETSSSTLGQIMPPIMGASAFIMAQFLGISYLNIIVAAIIPALLFTLGIFMTVHFDAKKRNYGSIEILDNESKEVEKIVIPSWKELLNYKNIGTLVLPIIVLLIFIGNGFTIQLACFYAVLICVASFLLQDFKWSGIKTRLSTSVKVLVIGAQTMTIIVPLIACSQIIVSLLGKTGLAVKIGNLIVSLGSNSILLSLLAAAILALILGMGAPTTASYVLGASMAAPPLIALGIPPIAAHFFILYFAVVSAITPPVCSAAFIAAAMAEANWVKTALTAMRMSFAAFIVPFIFAYNSSLLLVEGTGSEVIIDIVTAILGVISFCAMSSGYFMRNSTIYERIILGIAAILLIVPVWYLSIIGVFMLLTVFFIQYFGHNVINNPRTLSKSKE